MREYDSPKTLFYLDPPYYVAGPQLYKHCFSHADHLRLADCVRGLSAKFVLSYDDYPVIRDLYRGYCIKAVDHIYSINGTRKNHELIIKNF